MRHVRSLGYDDLESRKLLTKSHLAIAAHPAAAVVTVPLALDGSLTVDNKAAVSSTDGSDDQITSVPVTGTLSGAGQVHGVWTETDDSFGDYLGPDTLQLTGATGSIVVAFNAGSLGKAHRSGPKTFYYELKQRLSGGTGNYARSSESGTIELNTNAARTTVETLTLSSTTP